MLRLHEKQASKQQKQTTQKVKIVHHGKSITIQRTNEERITRYAILLYIIIVVTVLLLLLCSVMGKNCKKR